jgi:hypothetical protein
MKSTKVEVAKRVSEVYKLRLGGAEFPDIREYAAAPEQNWGVSDSQLWRYIKAADALCQEYLDARGEHLLARHILQRRQLFAHAMGAGDHRTALAVLKDEADLEALYPAQRAAAPGDQPTGEAAPVGTADVVRLLGARLRQVDQAELPAAEKARLTAGLADALLRAIGVDVIDKRLEALAAVLNGRKEGQR